MLFTFGRYAGYRLSEIPTPYLKRAVLFDRIGITLRDGIRMELARRIAIRYGHALEDQSTGADTTRQAIIAEFAHTVTHSHNGPTIAE